MTGAKEVFVKGNSTFTKTLTGLKNGKTYYVKIQTYKTVSGKTYWSSWSKTKSIKVDQIPYGSSIKKLTQVSDSKLKIDWEKAPGTTGYHIQYDYYENDEELVRKDVYVSGEGTLSKTITGLKNNTDYSVRIQTYRKTSGKTFWSSWSRWHDIYIDY
jgi:sulfatase maturation enzyme AslB (radical SAM superfamily)